MTAGGKSYYYLTDALGSVIGLADIDGNKVDSYTYSPRGVRILAQSSEPVAQPYRFAGNYQDPTGLYHLKARYYDANLGRFTQPDPSGQEQNPYLYAEGDPVNRIDPIGLFSFPDASGALDWASLTQKIMSGDTEGAYAAEVGILVGIGTEAVCGAAAAAGAVPTLGASIGAGITGCTVLSVGLGAAASAGTEAAL
ncbi:RHS repeat-associated core domain-containing protein [Streptomyces bauhiniae]|uniref:RHS repeat-associated core domain-containing protein n=1 Tax=Streptomyces bauhiniae TaxID=2340725 RepID=UPI003643FA1B